MMQHLQDLYKQEEGSLESEVGTGASVKRVDILLNMVKIDDKVREVISKD